MAVAGAVAVEPRSESAVRARLLYEAHVELDAPLDVGPTPHGVRRIVGIRGGSLEGPSMRGEILPAGADWLLVRPDGVVELDIRAVGRLEDGSILYATERGYLRAPPEVMTRIARGEPVEPGDYAFRVVVSYETASPRHESLNGTLGYGIGTLRRGGLDLVVHELL